MDYISSKINLGIKTKIGSKCRDQKYIFAKRNSKCDVMQGRKKNILKKSTKVRMTHGIIKLK